MLKDQNLSNFEKTVLQVNIKKTKKSQFLEIKSMEGLLLTR